MFTWGFANTHLHDYPVSMGFGLYLTTLLPPINTEPSVFTQKFVRPRHRKPVCNMQKNNVIIQCLSII